MWTQLWGGLGGRLVGWRLWGEVIEGLKSPPFKMLGEGGYLVYPNQPLSPNTSHTCSKEVQGHLSNLACKNPLKIPSSALPILPCMFPEGPR